ncbi:MAG: DUF4956 domain-containing protein, partial [Yaniella sp.]|nr:DUF4956 domain-containing protein [Yaniella sp.]MDN5888994.1 DUF4956 domain-containing protein [Yaniella sp.]MDN6148805.1 DUF4956 domain-containing protein [Yaniella sp.]
EQLLDAKVLHTVVLELDMVRDLTIVDVRYRTNGPVDNIPVPKKARNNTTSATGYPSISAQQPTYGLAQGPASVSTNRV